MDMNRAFFLKKESQNPQWRVVDAENRVLGRLATYVADALRGKDKPLYTPHADAGDYVVVINAEKIVLTGNKTNNKEYSRYTGWMGGYKVCKAKDMKPEAIIIHAIKGMLPKNKLSRTLLKKLRVYSGSEHPHKAQVTKA